MSEVYRRVDKTRKDKGLTRNVPLVPAELYIENILKFEFLFFSLHVTFIQ
jgi:hypothetical protein